MKNFLFVLLLLFAFLNTGFGQQIPLGNLWVHTSGTPGKLGFFETTTGAYEFAQNMELGDIILYDSLLLAGKDNLYIFSASSGEKLDSLIGMDISQMDMWGDKVVTISYTQPYFRVFSLASMSQVFTLDTNKIEYPGADLVVVNDLAFFSRDTFVQVVDLVAQDTLLRIQTEHPFLFGGMNHFLVAYNDFIFVDVEYATGAIRSSMLKIDLSDFSCQTLYHLEGNGNLFPPLPVGDTLFIMDYPAYYDIANDSLHPLQWSGELKAALDYDSPSKCLFVYDYMQHSITVEKLSTGDSLMGFQLSSFLGKALFYPTIITGKEDLVAKNEIEIFPVPASSTISIQINNWKVSDPSINIYLISGEKIENLKNSPTGNGVFNVDISHLTPGIYILEIQDNKLSSFKRIAIVR